MIAIIRNTVVLTFVLFVSVMVSPSLAAYNGCAFGDCGSNSSGGSASSITIDTTNFQSSLSSSDSNVQSALQTLDGAVSGPKKDWYLKIPTPSDLHTTGSLTQDDEVWRMVEFNGDLYVSYYTAYNPEQAKIYKWDGNDLTLFHTFGTGVHFVIVDIAVYNGRLYAGITGQSAGDADIYVYDPATDAWTISYTDADHNGVFQMLAFNGKLYAGFSYGTDDADIYSFDGTTWTEVYAASGESLIESMNVFNGKLYVGGGTGSAGGAFIKETSDGATWTEAFDGSASTVKSILNIVGFKGSLYAATKESLASGPEVIRYSGSGTTWTDFKDDDSITFCHNLVVYNDRLYAGCTDTGAGGQGTIWVHDGINGTSGWTNVFTAPADSKEPFRFYVYNGELLCGFGYDYLKSNIYAYREPVADQISSVQRNILDYLMINDSNNTLINSSFSGWTFGGNTSIGTTTTAPTHRLDIYGSNATSGTQDFNFYKSTGGTPVFTIGNGGRLGINVTTPSTLLGAVGGLEINGNLMINGSSLPALTFGSDFKAFIIGSAQTNPDISIWNGSSTSRRFTVPNAAGVGGWFTGNVGVNDSTPSTELDVSGTTGPILQLARNDTTVTSADVIGRINFDGNDTQLTTQTSFGKIEIVASQTVSTDAAAGNMDFYTTSTSVASFPTKRMSVLANGGVLIVPPSAQTISAGNTIADDGCGTIKKVTSAGAVTTDTTNTFTAPATGNSGCCMDVVNVGANNITLDNNANFVSFGAADVVLTANDAVRVCSTGASGKWYQTGLLVAN